MKAINPSEIPLEQRAYEEFYTRQFGRKPLKDEQGRIRSINPILEMGFYDAFNIRKRQVFLTQRGVPDYAKQQEYNVGYEGGMFERIRQAA